jgi:hypothetical protein
LERVSTRVFLIGIEVEVEVEVGRRRELLVQTIMRPGVKPLTM